MFVKCIFFVGCQIQDTKIFVAVPQGDPRGFDQPGLVTELDVVGNLLPADDLIPVPNDGPL